VNLALVRKELRDQRPFVALGLFFCAAEVFELLFLELPDQRPFWVNWTREVTTDAYGTLILIIALAMAWGLLVREHDERTLEFLDGLPISRPAQFVTKVGIGLVVLMIYPVFLAGIVLVEHLLSRNSLDPGLHLQPLAMQVGMLLIASAVVLSVGLVLSFLRRLGWLVLAALLVGYLALEAKAPWVRNFSPLRLTIPEYVGMRWRWPGQLLRFQLPVLAACLLASGLLYAARFEDWLRWLGRVLSTRAAKVGMVMSVAVLVGVFGAAAGKRYAGKSDVTANVADRDADEEDDEDEDVPARQKVSFAPPIPITSETRHYRFSYLSSARSRALPLIDRGDAVFETVQMFFGAPPGDRVTADLTGSATHTAGTAYWNTVRMDLSHDRTAAALAAILGHETTHVFVQRLGRANETGVSSRLWPLDEGLASYVEHRFFEAETPIESQDRVLAALRARRELIADELVSPERLLKARGRDMAYPMGRLFVEALIGRYGDDAPRRIFVEAGRRDLPSDLDQAQLWSELFVANGYDLGLIVDDFYGAADRLVRTHRAWVDRLPRPRGAVEMKKGVIVLRSSLDRPLPEGWSVVCRHRAAEDTSFDRFQAAYEDDGAFRWPRTAVSGQRVWFQLGLRDRSGLVLYEPWTSVPLE